MSPKALNTLREALVFARGEQKKESPAEVTILAMMKLYGATRVDTGNNGYRLRCGAVAAHCTSSRDSGLLSAWLRLANAKLQAEMGK